MKLSLISVLAILLTLTTPCLQAAKKEIIAPKQVSIVLPQKGFNYQEYIIMRQTLEKGGYTCVVTTGSLRENCIPAPPSPPKKIVPAASTNTPPATSTSTNPAPVSVTTPSPTTNTPSITPPAAVKSAPAPAAPAKPGPVLQTRAGTQPQKASSTNTVDQVIMIPPVEVKADIPLGNVEVNRYRAIVFIGGWGASNYQFGFTGNYHNSHFTPGQGESNHANRLIFGFMSKNKPVAALGYGSTILAWGRVPAGSQVQSSIKGKKITGSEEGCPGGTFDGKNHSDNELPVRAHIEANGGIMPPANSIGSPDTDEDDVVIDLPFFTGQNSNSAKKLAEALVEYLNRTTPQ